MCWSLPGTSLFSKEGERSEGAEGDFRSSTHGSGPKSSSASSLRSPPLKRRKCLAETAQKTNISNFNKPLNSGDRRPSPSYPVASQRLQGNHPIGSLRIRTSRAVIVTAAPPESASAIRGHTLSKSDESMIPLRPSWRTRITDGNVSPPNASSA